MLRKIKNFGQAFENRERIILRDYLALERTKLANERTLMSYLRTSLYMLIGGITFLQLSELEDIRWIGYFSLMLSAAFIFIGVLRYYIIKKRLNKYYKESRKIADS